MALADPCLTLSEISNEAQRQHLQGSLRAGCDQRSQCLKCRGEVSCLFKVYSKQISHSNAKGLAHQQASQYLSQLWHHCICSWNHRLRGTLEKGSSNVRHSASKGNTTACVKVQIWFYFYQHLTLLCYPGTSSPSWLKGKKNTAATLFQQNDSPIQHCVTSSFTTLSVSPSTGLKTRPEGTTSSTTAPASTMK